MPLKVSDSSSFSDNKGDEFDRSFFIQKPYFRTNHSEANIEENIDMKNEFRIKNLP